MSQQMEAFDMKFLKALYCLPEARELLGGVSHTKIYELKKKGLINFVKIGRRSYITAEEIERFIAGLAD